MLCIPCFTVGILIGVVTLSRGQGAGGTATPQSPKANDLLRGFTRGQCQFQRSRCGWGRGGGVAKGWGKLWSYGEVLYITVSRSYGSSCLLDVVTVCHRWSGRGGLHTSCSLYNLPTIYSHCVVYISCVTVYSMYRLYGCTLSNSSSACLDIAY